MLSLSVRSSIGQPTAAALDPSVACVGSTPAIQQQQIIYTIILLKSVSVRKLQVAILARFSLKISQTVRIDCHSFLSRVHISVRPSKFFVENYREKLSR